MGQQEKVLVVFVSAGGATERYAQIIADVLRTRGHGVDMVDLKRDRVADLSAYGTVILGTGVRMTMVYRRGKQFLGRRDLRGRRLAVFLSSGMAIEDPDGAKKRFLMPLVKKNALEPVMVDAFPGKMPGAGGKLEDKSDADAARRWAEALALIIEED
jgi:menaquinone-dependent protoporphyrinogen IX oxidase